MKKALKSGDDVMISGFGKFCVRNKRERPGRNPATGGDMMLRLRKVVMFKGMLYRIRFGASHVKDGGSIVMTSSMYSR